MIKEVVNNDFSEVLAARTAVVDFKAVWCGPCKMMHPVLEKVSDLLADKAEFFAADIDDNDELVSELADSGVLMIQAVPTLAVFKDGKCVASTVGFVPQPQLEAWLSENL